MAFSASYSPREFRRSLSSGKVMGWSLGSPIRTKMPFMWGEVDDRYSWKKKHIPPLQNICSKQWSEFIPKNVQIRVVRNFTLILKEHFSQMVLNTSETSFTLQNTHPFAVPKRQPPNNKKYLTPKICPGEYFWNHPSWSDPNFGDFFFGNLQNSITKGNGTKGQDKWWVHHGPWTLQIVEELYW